MIEALLKQHGGELLKSLTGAGDLDAGQAKSLLPPAISGISNAVSGGDVDLNELLGGGGGAVAALLGKLNVSEIAAAAGLDKGLAQKGLTSLIPAVISLLGDKAGGVEGLASLLGGDKSGALGALGGIAGKLFKK